MSTKQAPANTGWVEKLNDGTPVRIRPISKKDADLELEFLRRLSPEYQRLRFLGLVRAPTDEVVRELTAPDPRHAAALIAVVSQDGRDHQVGAAHFYADADSESCDCSVTVCEEWQKRGVGSLLMGHLIAAARARGIRNMHAVAPADGEDSRQLASRIGFRRRPDREDPAVMIYDLPLR